MAIGCLALNMSTQNCEYIRIGFRSVTNPFLLKRFRIDEKKRLALDRAKSISANRAGKGKVIHAINLCLEQLRKTRSFLHDHEDDGCVSEIVI